MTNNSKRSVSITPPTLPKGGGAINGLRETLETPGSDGMLRLTVPLPVSQARGYAPEMGLIYGSDGGNSSFGLGWNINLPSIRRRTGIGVLSYTAGDQFLGPDGNVLIPEQSEKGEPITRISRKIQNVDLGQDYKVTRFFPRVESDFHKIEWWVSTTQNENDSFWIVRQSTGEICCYGKEAQARVADPQNSAHIAQWLLQESQDPYGEHIYYQYISENNENVVETQTSHNYEANRYLSQVFYANKEQADSLYALNGNVPADDKWHCILVLDYGQRTTTEDVPPSYVPSKTWQMRLDPYSTYIYGFEVRTCRLCRQVLLFHSFPELGDTPYLVNRMLLEYKEDAAVTLLSGIQQIAYEKNGSALNLPPLDLDYTTGQQISNGWEEIPIVNVVDWRGTGTQYQFVDLYGEGIPGVLYTDDKGWYYREPERDPDGTQDAIRYREWRALDNTPSIKENGALLDLDGDGYLEWVVAGLDGIRGYHTISQEGFWSPLIPLKALPLEMFHPDAKLVDLTGSGAIDLVLVGPRCVKFYENVKGSFGSVVKAWESVGIELPLNSINEREIVAFGDILGTGQQHLIRIRHDGVVCWPNLGNGHMGAPLEIPGFQWSQQDFAPERVLLVDTDGTGTLDILYAEQKRLLLYHNLSGNRFADPVEIPLPDGVLIDDYSRLLAADTQGIGVTDIVLCIPFGCKHNWKLSFNKKKPYMLQRANNNRGVNYEIYFRSSAQYWLDEKQRFPQHHAGIPFPLHLVSRIEVTDEISETVSIEEFTYYGGNYDRKENDLAGFGMLERRVSYQDIQGEILSQRPGAITKSWYHTGVYEDNLILTDLFWPDGNKTFALKEDRFTQMDKAGTDQPYDPTTAEFYWMLRSFIGTPFRIEVWGDGETPIAVTINRYQSRLLQSAIGQYGCIAFATLLEQISITYEQIRQDPRCTHSIIQKLDKYGAELQSVQIQYPRQPQPNENPYPSTLPETSWNSSYDEQQMILRLSRNKLSVYNLDENENWRLGLHDKNRIDAFAFDGTVISESILSFETLNANALPEASILGQEYCGQTESVYDGGDGKPTPQALLSFTRVAMLDEKNLAAFADALAPNDLKSKLLAGGYVISPRLFNDTSEEDVWCAERNLSVYGNAFSFYRQIISQSSSITGEIKYTWDEYHVEIAAVEDGLENTMHTEYDYRFFAAVKSIDANQNHSMVYLDSLGRPLYGIHWGSEGGEPIGFDPSISYTAPKTAEEAMSIQNLPVAFASVYVTRSWMGQVSSQQINNYELWEQLIKEGYLTQDGFVRSRLYRTDNKLLPDSIMTLLNSNRMPTHMISLTSDRYPNDLSQQVSAAAIFYDGYGHVIQTANRVTEKTGMDAQWTISEKAVNCGGLPLRSLYPSFSETWKYQKLNQLKSPVYGKSFTYDNLGRLVREKNDKDYYSSTQYYPWFTVAEDENDTLLKIN